MSFRIGIDTGGTFTDVVLVDDVSGRLVFHKVASTPDDPGRALVRGVSEVAALAGVPAAAVELLIHGTTVATNAVLQRRGSRAALVTTRGFRDVLHIQRQDRPSLYDLRARRAEPLVPREWRFEIGERMLFDGSVERPVDAAEVTALVETLRAEGIEAVAVGLLHSYVNPAHEQAVGELLRVAMPELTVCLSSDLVGEHGEYERFSTAAMNAFVQPVMQRYLGSLSAALDADGLRAPLFVMKSNGGVMDAEAAGRQCVETILSGPAGGVVAGADIARRHRHGNLITADMGGTSFDVAVIRDGQAGFAREAEMGGLAIGVPLLDIHTVGAGGGSVGWIDAGGALRVGPESAGAVPGPACYGRGGTRPTVTDANLVLGRLAANSLLAGDMQMDREAAERAIHDHLAKPLGISLIRAAEGMIRVVNAAMNAAIRTLTVQRGFDPREFALCPFGGAGPLHASELAAELGIREIIVPVAPGVNSAVGLLMSNLREDRLRTHVRPWDAVTASELADLTGELLADARARLGQLADHGELRVSRALGVRYLGQRYDIAVPLADGPVDLAATAGAFHDLHRQRYGYARDGEALELASLWLSAEVVLTPAALPTIAAGTLPAPVSHRPVVFAGEALDTPVYSRAALPADARLSGPAVIEQLDSTTLILPGQAARVDDTGQLHLSS